MSKSNVSSLHIYPIKSTAGIDIPAAQVTELGLDFDRRFVLSDPTGQFITARTEPRLCLVKTELTEQGLLITAENMQPLTLSYAEFTTQYQQVNVWGDDIAGQLCSSLASQWFSDYLQRPCQLLFFGSKSHRERKPGTEKARKVAFADGYPLLLISQASLDDLNQRLANQQVDSVSMAHFRPNIVVEDCSAFEEDTWHHIRIGEVEFKLSKPCERCIFTTINPSTAEKNQEVQPLRTLKSFRQTLQGEVMFGQNLIPLNQGQIKPGDKVVVLSKQKPLTFKESQIKPATLIDKANKTEQQSGQEMQLTCQQIIPETHDVKTFVFSWCGDSQVTQFAGQHISFKVNIFGNEQACCYTISSPPSVKKQLQITIKRVPNGKVSNFFHDHFSVGDTVTSQAPSGNFHLPEVIPRKVLLLSAGSGITPMLSMLRFMTMQQVKNQITFFHSAHSEDDLIAQQEVSELAKQHGNCQISYTLTQRVKPQWQGYQGHLTEKMLSNIPDLLNYEVYVCGPEGFRQSAQQYLIKLGLSKEQYHYEIFGSKKTMKSTEKPTNNEVKIHFEKWNKHYKTKNQKTLLEHGEDAGLILPYSCRAGMCSNCKAKLIKGEVTQLATDGLTAQEVQNGYILCCSSIPKTDVTIKHD